MHQEEKIAILEKKVEILSKFLAVVVGNTSSQISKSDLEHQLEVAGEGPYNLFAPRYPDGSPVTFRDRY